MESRLPINSRVKFPFSSLEESSSSEEEFVKHRRKILKLESLEICQDPLRDQEKRIKKQRRRRIRHHRNEQTRNPSFIFPFPSLNTGDAWNEMELIEQNHESAILGKDEFPIDEIFEAKKDITGVVHGSELILPSSIVLSVSSTPETIPDENNLDPVDPDNSILQSEILSPQQEIDIPQLSLAEDLLNWIKSAPPLPIDLQKELERNNILSLDSLSEAIQSGKDNERYRAIEKMKSTLKPIPRKKFDNYLSQSFPCLTPSVVKNKIPPETQAVSVPNLEAVPSEINTKMSSVSYDAFNHYSQAINTDSHMMVHESINTSYILHHNLKSLGSHTPTIVTQVIRSPKEEEIEEAIQYAETLPEGGEIVITEAEKERSIEELKKEFDLENDFINQINDITTSADSDLVLSTAAKEVLNQSKTNHQLRAKRLKRLIMEKKKQSNFSTQAPRDSKYVENSLELQEEKITETKVSSSNEFSQPVAVKDMIDVYQCDGMKVIFSRIVKIREGKITVVGLSGVEDINTVRLKGESFSCFCCFISENFQHLEKERIEALQRKKIEEDKNRRNKSQASFWTCQICKHENEFQASQSLKCQLCSTKAKHRSKFHFDIFNHTNRSSFGARELTEGKNWSKKNNKNTGKSKGQTDSLVVETGKKRDSGYEYNDKYHESQSTKKGSANDHEFGITLDQFPPLPKKNHLPIPIAEKQCGKNQLREEKMKATPSSRISNEAVDAIAACVDNKRKDFQERNEWNHEFPSNDPPRGKRQMNFHFCGSCELPIVISEIKQLKGSIFCAKCYDRRKSEKITSDVLNDEENQNDCKEDEEGNFEEVSSVDGNDGTFKQSSVIGDSDDETDSNEYQDAKEGNLKDDNTSPAIQKRQKEENEGSNNDEGSDDEKRDNRGEKISDESKSTGMFALIPTGVVNVISSISSISSILLPSEAPELVLQCNRCGEQSSEESRNCVKCGNAFINLRVKGQSEKKREDVDLNKSEILVHYSVNR